MGEHGNINYRMYFRLLICCITCGIALSSVLGRGLLYQVAEWRSVFNGSVPANERVTVDVFTPLKALNAIKFSVDSENFAPDYIKRAAKAKKKYISRVPAKRRNRAVVASKKVRTLVAKTVASKVVKVHKIERVVHKTRKKLSYLLNNETRIGIGLTMQEFIELEEFLSSDKYAWKSKVEVKHSVIKIAKRKPVPIQSAVDQITVSASALNTMVESGGSITQQNIPKVQPKKDVKIVKVAKVAKLKKKRVVLRKPRVVKNPNPNNLVTQYPSIVKVPAHRLFKKTFKHRYLGMAKRADPASTEKVAIATTKPPPVVQNIIKDTPKVTKSIKQKPRGLTQMEIVALQKGRMPKEHVDLERTLSQLIRGLSVVGGVASGSTQTRQVPLGLNSQMRVAKIPLPKEAPRKTVLRRVAKTRLVKVFKPKNIRLYDEPKIMKKVVPVKPLVKSRPKNTLKMVVVSEVPIPKILPALAYDSIAPNKNLIEPSTEQLNVKNVSYKEKLRTANLPQELPRVVKKSPRQRLVRILKPNAVDPFVKKKLKPKPVAKRIEPELRRPIFDDLVGSQATPKDERSIASEAAPASVQDTRPIVVDAEPVQMEEAEQIIKDLGVQNNLVAMNTHPIGSKIDTSAAINYSGLRKQGFKELDSSPKVVIPPTPPVYDPIEEANTQKQSEEALLVPKAQPTPAPILAPAPKKLSKYVKIQGRLLGAKGLFTGHFEVGFYSRVDPLGLPLGAPSPQAILQEGVNKFELVVPRSKEGFLFARHIPAAYPKKKMKWFGYPSKIRVADADAVMQVGLVIESKEKAVATRAFATEKLGFTTFSGNVGAMFSPSGKFLALDRVKIGIRGTDAHIFSNPDGSFKLRIPLVRGQFLLEFLKLGYLPQLVEAEVKSKEYKSASLHVELASMDAVRHMAHSLGMQQSDSQSVLIIKAASKNAEDGLPGLSFQLSLDADGPYYFSSKGFPQRELQSTSSDGRAIYFNVEKGIGFLESFVLGERVAPIVVSVIEGNDIIVKKVTILQTRIRGRLSDPINGEGGKPKAIVGARVRVAGSTDWTETDSFGVFEVPHNLYIGDSEILLEVTANGFYNHRYSYRVTRDKTSASNLIQLYAFPQKYINGLANAVELELNPAHGLLMGQVGSGRKLRIDALSDHSEQNNAKDFYFDSESLIQGSHSFTDPGYGTYSIFDLSAGRTLLYGYDESGVLRYSDVGYFSPSTVSIVVGKK